MYRYILFKGDDFYPLGGMEDLHSHSENLEDLLSLNLVDESDIWAHIFDCLSQRIIYKIEKFQLGNWTAEYRWVKIYKCLNCGEIYEKNLSGTVCDECFPKVVSTEKIIAKPC